MAATNSADASEPIQSEPTLTKLSTAPSGVTPTTPQPVSHASLPLEKVERWIRIGLATEAYLTPAGLRRFLGEEEVPKQSRGRSRPAQPMRSSP